MEHIQQLVQRLAMLPVPLHKVWMGFAGLLRGAILSNRFVPRDNREDLLCHEGRLDRGQFSLPYMLALGITHLERELLASCVILPHWHTCVSSM